MLISKIKEKEFLMMDNYITNYAYSYLNTKEQFVGSKAILKHCWNTQKAKLFKLFGEELILSKYVNLEKTTEELQHEFYYNAEFCTLRIRMKDFIRPNLQIQEVNDRATGYSYTTWLNLVFDIINFAKNEICLIKSYGCDYITFVNEEGKTVKIEDGMKAIKAVSKLWKLVDGDPEILEKFRLIHSQVLNRKNYRGELCLSIHPMDFMTMSDNANGWSSCMSWCGEGEYRAGTVEMMNSESVIVAYLKSGTETMLDGEWNSKKWRSLYVVDENFIVPVKGYPYQSSEIDKEVLKWLAELAAANCQWEYGDVETVKYERGTFITGQHPRKTHFSTYTMYCDFGARDEFYGIFNKTFLCGEDLYSFCYSGPRQCMYCGETDCNRDFDEPSDLICCECGDSYSNYITCDCCGYRMNPDWDEYYEYDGAYYCLECYNDTFSLDDIAQEDDYIDDLENLYIFPTDEDANADLETRRRNHTPLYVMTNVLNTYGSWDWNCIFHEANGKYRENIHGEYYMLVEDLIEPDRFIRYRARNGYTYNYDMKEYLNSFSHN